MNIWPMVPTLISHFSAHGWLRIKMNLFGGLSEHKGSKVKLTGTLPAD